MADSNAAKAPEKETYLVEKAGSQKPEETPVPEKATKKYTWKGEDGKVINYEGNAELIDIFTDDGTPICHMFELSYISDDEDKSDRPITFLWNGGPGGSSSMVCIGGMGPHRVPTDGSKHLKNTCPLEDNPYTLLQVSDLVFIDAPGTGYSHIAEGYDPKKVWGVDGDGDAFSRAIIAWINEYDAWDRPIYLYGESYGTTRAAVVYRMLGERGVGVMGVVEQSTILDYTIMHPGNDDYYAGMFPVMAATAQSSGKVGRGVDPNEWFEKAMDFSDDVLIAALTKDERLPQDEMEKVAEQMSEFIGMPTQFILDRKLRIELYEFRAWFDKDKGLTHGRYDTRFTEQAYQPVQGELGFFQMEDPSYDAIQVVYNQVYMKMLRDMGFKGYKNYIALNMKVNEEWNFKHNTPGVGETMMPDVAFDIATAIRRNPNSNVIFLGGRHDGATPFWNVRHAIGKMFLPEPLKSHIHYNITSNGHMLYADTEALKDVTPVLHKFYDLRHEPIDE